MLSRIRRIALLELVAIAAAFVWLIVSDFRFTGTPLWPNENTLIGSWIFYLLLEGLMPLPLLGFWLLFEAHWRGGGRWWWRWWLGGLVALSFFGEVVEGVALAGRREVLYPITAHPWVDTILVLAAIFPLWIATAPRDAS